MSDASGSMMFVYTGGYSTHTFTITEGVQPEIIPPVVSTGSTNTTTVSPILTGPGGGGGGGGGGSSSSSSSSSSSDTRSSTIGNTNITFSSAP